MKCEIFNAYIRFSIHECAVYFMHLVFSHVVDSCLLQTACILYLHELSKIPTLAWAIKQKILSQVRIPLIRVVDSA